VKLKRLHVKNYCQHQERNIEFKEGITGVFGANGSGKSNLLKAAYISLTNDFTRNPGTKADHVRDGTAITDEAYIEAVWNHGDDFRRVIHLQSSHQQLWLPGQAKPMTAIKESQRVIEQMLGLSRQVLDNYVFIGQQQLMQFFKVTPSRRSELFAHLCQTTLTQKLHEQLGDVINNERSLLRAVDRQELDITQQELKKVNKELRDGVTRLAEAQSKLAEKYHAEKAAKAEQLLQQVATVTKLQETKARLERTLKASNAEAAQLVTGIKEAEDYLTNSQKLLKEKDKLEAVVDKGELLKQAFEQYNQLVYNCKVAKAELDELVEPVAPSGYATGVLTVLRDQLAEVKEKRAQSVKIIEASKDGKAVCGVCGSPIKDFAKHHKNIETLAGTIQTLTEQIRVYQKHESELASYNSELKSNTNYYNLLTQQLNVATKPEFDLDKFKKAQSRLKELAAVNDKQVTLKTEKLSSLRNDQVQVQSKIQTATQELSKIAVQLVELDQAKVDKAQKFLTNKQSLEQEISDLNAEQKANKLRKAQLQDYQNRILAKIEETEKQETWLARLEELRQVFHRDQLPKTVHEFYLEEIANEINKNLEDYDSPFRVKVGKNLSFNYKKPRSAEKSFEWLSGGELAVLALAFHFANANIFAGNLNMSVLDEPTDGLDVKNLGCLEQALQALSAKSKTNGHQVIIVTHDSRLERVFDHSIVLEN